MSNPNEPTEASNGQYDMFSPEAISPLLVSNGVLILGATALNGVSELFGDSSTELYKYPIGALVGLGVIKLGIYIGRVVSGQQRPGQV